MMDWNDEDTEEQETGPVAVARSLSRADEEQEMPEPQEPVKASPTELQQVAADDDGSQYARPIRSEVSGPNDEELDPEQQYSRPSETSPANDEDGGGAPAGLKAPVLPAVPQYADNAQNFRDLEARYAKFNPADYKPSIGRRIAAGLAGGAVAFGSRNPAEGMKVAESVNSAPLDRARARLESDVRPIQQRIADTGAQNQQQRQQYADASQQYGMQERNLTNQARIADWNAQADQRKEQAQVKLNTVDKNTLGPVDPGNPFGEWQGRTPGGQVVRGLEPPAAIQKSPAFIRQQRTQDLQEMERNGIRLTSQERKFYFANGKLAEPTEHTSINIRENPDGSAVTPRGAQGPQGIDELIAQHVNDKQAFADGWQRVDAAHASPKVPEGSYVNKDTDLNDVKLGDFVPSRANFLTSQQFNDKIDQFRTKLNANAAMRKSGTMLDEQGNVVSNRFAPPGQRQTGPAQAQPAAPPAVAAPKTFNKGEIPPNVPLPANNVWVKAPNGVVGHIPQANLQKAIARGYAVPEGQ